MEGADEDEGDEDDDEGGFLSCGHVDGVALPPGDVLLGWGVIMLCWGIAFWGLRWVLSGKPTRKPQLQS